MMSIGEAIPFPPSTNLVERSCSLSSRKPDDSWTMHLAENREQWRELGFLIHRKAVFEGSVANFLWICQRFDLAIDLG